MFLIWLFQKRELRVSNGRSWRLPPTLINKQTIAVRTWACNFIFIIMWQTVCLPEWQIVGAGILRLLIRYSAGIMCYIPLALIYTFKRYENSNQIFIRKNESFLTLFFSGYFRLTHITWPAKKHISFISKDKIIAWLQIFYPLSWVFTQSWVNIA